MKGVPHVISGQNWSKLQATLAFFVLTGISGAVSCFTALVVLHKVYMSDSDQATFLVWCGANTASFIFSFVGLWPFVMFMSDAGARYGEAFSLAVTACVLYLLLSLAAFWLRTQLAVGSRRRGTRRRRRKDGESRRSNRRGKTGRVGSEDGAQLRSLAFYSDDEEGDAPEPGLPETIARV